MALELWSARIPEVGTVVDQAERAEHHGWDGITFTDSQNLVGDPFVAVALAAQATDRLRFATGVTNAHTRHPAALATAAATVQETSGGRFVLGIGRGDTALFHLGRKPMPVDRFASLASQVQTYLAGGTVDCDGHPSRLRWLDRARQPKVPLDVAASGPRMIGFAARAAERVTFAVGADPGRVAWALDLARKAAADAGRDPAEISFGAYVNVGCHPDVDAARALVAGTVAAFAHFSAMPGSPALTAAPELRPDPATEAAAPAAADVRSEPVASTAAGEPGPVPATGSGAGAAAVGGGVGSGLRDGDREVVAEVGRRYDSNEHLSNRAVHTGPLAPEFVDRFAIVGPTESCVERFAALVALGVDRFVVTGPGFDADPDHARTASRLVTHELLPALRERGTP
jgi:5,10-methylenetetrahydromethanopterin reductase